MKTQRLLQSGRLLFLFLSVILFNCSGDKENDNPEPETNIGCKLSEITFENTETDELGNMIAHSKERLKHEYDEKLKLTSTDQASERWKNDTLISKRAYRNDCQYNTDDFLTSNIVNLEESTLENGQLIPTKTGSKNAYQYQNQKLTGNTSKSFTGMDTTGTSTQVLEYSSKGQLVKKTITTPNNKITSVFTNGILTSYEESNPAYPQKITLNALGFQSIVTSSFSGIKTENRNIYDSRGNLTKAEFYVNSTLSSYVTYSYGSTNMQSKALFQFKGHPLIPSIIGSSANLISKTESFVRDNNSGFRKAMETTFEYDFNASGHYTTLRITGKYFNEKGNIYKSSKGTQTMSYVGCL